MRALNVSNGADVQEEAKLEAWEVDMIAKIERVEARFADLDGRTRHVPGLGLAARAGAWLRWWPSADAFSIPMACMSPCVITRSPHSSRA